MTKYSKIIASVIGVALIVFTGAAFAQSSGLTRTVVTKADVSVPNREAVVARVEIAPGGESGWHTHSGDEISYVTEGELTLMIAGQPARKVEAGEALVIPAGTVHNVKNEGTTPVKLIGVFVVEKGKPLANPVSEPLK